MNHPHLDFNLDLIHPYQVPHQKYHQSPLLTHSTTATVNLAREFSFFFQYVELGT